MEAANRAPGARGKRALTPGDLSNLEALGEVALSPDGRSLAYVVKRPRSSSRFHKYDFLDGGDRADVWLVDVSGGAPRNLTNGASDGSGYWAPRWSLDSGWLALLSTKGGNVHLWGWDLGAGRLVRLCGDAVDLTSRDAPHLWLSGRTLVVPTLPAGERPLMMRAEIEAAEAAMREWPKAWAGEETTRSALDSGSHAPFHERPQGALMLVDVVSGVVETLMSGFFRDLRASPDRRHVAFLRQVDVVRPKPDQTLRHGGDELHRVGVVGAGGDDVVDGLAGVGQPVRRSLRWSPDSAELAMISRDDEVGSGAAQVFRYRLGDGALERATDARLDAASVVWTAAGQLLALAEAAHDSNEERPRRSDWWLVEDYEAPRNLSADLDAVPQQLFRERGRETLVGLAGGDIVRLSVDDGRWANLTESFGPKIAWLVWPPPDASDGESFVELVLAVDRGESTGWHRLDLRAGKLDGLSWPTAKGWLLAFDPEHATAVQVASDRAGTRLWVSRPAFDEQRALLETNKWLAEIAQGEVKRVDYRGLDGDELRGWLILPIDYQAGRRSPLVTWVYPGAAYTRETPPMRMLSIGTHHALDYQLLPARGYALLLPSMPLKPEDEASDPYLEVTKGVLPAVDRVIELGIADPDRLAVMGQSNGGYGVYALITQTQRFKAAVALAGFADLAGLYGQFDPRRRFMVDAHEHLFRMSLAESGQNRMGGPPWRETERYVRNSPLFRADRVETPMLIVQGDMDYVPMQQGEQFFTALYRQAKRARFVRYWGEGHVFQSPANIKSMWEEIYAWLDEFLAAQVPRTHQ